MDSKKKKKKKPTQRIRNQTHGHVVGRESRENQTPIQSIQTKAKQTPIQSYRGVYQKKKKKKTPIQSKPKPNQKNHNTCLSSP